MNVAAIRSTGLTASLGIAEHVCAIVGEAGRDARRRSSRSSPARRRASRRPWWRRAAEHRARDDAAARHRRGHDRRQGGAVRRRAAAAARGAARRSRCSTRGPGWVEQDPEDVLCAPWSRRSPRCSQDAPGEVVACGLDHQGESVLAWDAESGAPLTPIVVWQDKRSQEVLDRLERRRARASEIQRAQRAAARPLLLGGQARLAARARRRGRGARATPARCGWARSTPSSATGSAPASRPIPRPRRGRSSARPAVEPRPARALRRAARGPARRSPTRPATSARCGTTPGRRSCRCARAVVDQQAALAGAGCVEPGPHQGDLRHGRVRARERRRRSGPAGIGGLLPTVAWRVGGQVEWALDGGVFTAGALLEWLSARPGTRAGPAGAVAACARQVEDAGGVRVLPALSGIGAPWWRPEAHAADRRADRRRRGPRTSRARPGGDRLAGGGHRRACRRAGAGETSCASTAASRATRCCSSFRPTPRACRSSAAPWMRPPPARRRWPRSAPDLWPRRRDRRAHPHRRARRAGARRGLARGRARAVARVRAARRGALSRGDPHARHQPLSCSQRSHRSSRSPRSPWSTAPGACRAGGGRARTRPSSARPPARPRAIRSCPRPRAASAGTAS